MASLAAVLPLNPTPTEPFFRLCEGDAEIGKVLQVLLLHASYQRFRRDTFALGAQHDRRAVRVVGANINTIVSAQLLKTHPDIGLHVLEHMADVDRTIGIG